MSASSAITFHSLPTVRKRGRRAGSSSDWPLSKYGEKYNKDIDKEAPLLTQLGKVGSASNPFSRAKETKHGGRMGEMTCYSSRERKSWCIALLYVGSTIRTVLVRVRGRQRERTTGNYFVIWNHYSSCFWWSHRFCN